MAKNKPLSAPELVCFQKICKLDKLKLQKGLAIAMGICYNGRILEIEVFLCAMLTKFWNG